MLSIYTCNENDIDAVIDFIDKYWSLNHILVKDRVLLDWQYKNEDDSYNFVIARFKNEIIGILGFIPSNRYDKELVLKKFIWLAIWKIKDDCQFPAVGILLLKYLEKNFKNHIIAVNGINKEVENLYKKLNYYSGELTHYFLVNNFCEQKIIKGWDKPIKTERTIDQNFKNRWILLNKNYLLGLNKKNIIQKNLNFKSINYLITRYIENPFYKYRLYQINNDSKNLGIIVLRIIDINGSKVIRIVDYLGDINLLLFCCHGLINIMRSEYIEYADFYNFGVNKDILKKIGFLTTEKLKDIIVPNYFEPLQYENIKIRFAIKSNAEILNNIKIYKGDGDQDRPNKFIRKSS